MANISVAMAVYNGGQFLRAQLDSIIPQLGHCDELVISYDQSNDDTLEIITEYSQKFSQIKVFNNPDKGLFSNFENAISECNGDYIFISDQDDLWAPNKIKKVIDDFSKSNSGMVIHNGIHIDEADTPISNDFFSTFKIGDNKIRNFIAPRYSGCCTAFTKELKSIVIPIPRNVGAYDHWIGMVGQCFSKVFYDESVLIYHRLHGGNYTSKRRRLNSIMKYRYELAVELIKRKKWVNI